MKCIFCFNDSARIHHDRKDRPYYFCSLCSHRIFFRSPIALKAILVWIETAKALSQQEFLTMLQKVESTTVYQHQAIQKWVAKETIQEEVVERKEKNA